MGKFPWSKKPWEKVPCNFIVQEYDASVGRGWSDITEPTGEPPSISSAKELMKPGNHYRVIARAVEDSEKEGIKAGTYVGVAWKFYEPLVGGVRELKEPKAKVVKETKPTDVSELMSKYVDEIDRVVTPLAKLGEVFTKIRESVLGVAPSGGRGDSEEEEGEGGGYGEIPPLEFEGKAPWFMHPYVAHAIAEEIKGVIDFGAKRMEQVLKGGAEGEAAVAAEEEEPLLPSIKEYEAEKPAEEKVAEEEAEEPAAEEEEEKAVEAEEPVISTMEEPIEVQGSGMAPPKEKVVETPKEVEVVPSLLEEEKPLPAEVQAVQAEEAAGEIPPEPKEKKQRRKKREAKQSE